jgi:hypothetical protein
VTPVEDSAPPQFNVVAKISIGGSLGAGAGKKERELEEGDESATGGASVNASVKLAAELVYTHVMDESALKQYLAEADKLSEGGESSKQPEFGVLTKLNLWQAARPAQPTVQGQCSAMPRRRAACPKGTAWS